MNLVTDEELMLQVRSGEGETLGVLFERYHGPLFNFYARLMGDRTVSEDLVQEVFLRILRYRDTYQPGTPFRPWMYQIARNARMDHYRKTPRLETFEPDMLPPVAPHDSAQQQQEGALLHRALMRLSDEKREVLILARFQELKYTEIARLLGVELNTVKTRVHRALQDLREAFRELERGARKNAPSAAPNISLGRAGQ
ncbi:MAG TPA: sigma-70 family RNA polymerase sigma factor [Candidatus Acidoferrales bacterium]|nr:sigma-70 family RNA polymerase sigma factor [Candidatus Acidoferrales bacterium]